VNGQVVYTEQIDFSKSAGTGGNVGGQANGLVPFGASVTVTASPDAGYAFTRWERGSGSAWASVSTDASYTFTMNQDWRSPNNQLRAVFNLTVQSITVNSGGNGTASASVNSATMGTVVTLTPAPNAGYQFSNWAVVSGGVSVSNNQFTMGASNVVITANFTAIQYTITVTTASEGGNNMTNGAAGANYQTATIGTVVTLWATPQTERTVFKSWSVLAGGVSVNSNQFTMPAGNVSVRANFGVRPQSVLFQLHYDFGQYNGNASPQQQYYANFDGDYVDINEGMHFADRGSTFPIIFTNPIRVWVGAPFNTMSDANIDDSAMLAQNRDGVIIQNNGYGNYSIGFSSVAADYPHIYVRYIPCQLA